MLPNHGTRNEPANGLPSVEDVSHTVSEQPEHRIADRIADVHTLVRVTWRVAGCNDAELPGRTWSTLSDRPWHAVAR
jgi:hypothetical protein